MKYIIFGAGKTSMTLKRYFENCKLDDQIIGFFDFLGNNPFDLNYVSEEEIKNHEGKYIIGSIMADSISLMKKNAHEKFSIDLSDILEIQHVLPKIDLNDDLFLSFKNNFDNSYELYLKVLKARANFDFKYFEEMNFFKNSKDEYFKYDLIQKDDTIIDGGAFDGSTAKLFSDKIKKNGHVYSFDCSLEHILSVNKCNNISYFQNALYDEETILNFHKYEGIEAPGSFVSEKTSNIFNDFSIKSIRIDDFNANFMSSSKINFIKLDIEGAELKAILGSKEVLTKDKPNLAIACYHLIEHYWQIPQLINSINPNYTIGFDHYSNYFDGSVLYFY
jgi:FkbM family methyltransferase